MNHCLPFEVMSKSLCCMLMLHSIVFETLLIFLSVLITDSLLFLFCKNNSTLYIIYGIKHPNAYVWNFTCGFPFFIVEHVPWCVLCGNNMNVQKIESFGWFLFSLQRWLIVTNKCSCRLFELAETRVTLTYVCGHSSYVFCVKYERKLVKC